MLVSVGKEGCLHAISSWWSVGRADANSAKALKVFWVTERICSTEQAQIKSMSV